MIEETHSLKCVYKGVQPYVKVTAYELSSVDCSSDKTSGYYGETATLTANAAPAGYNFSGWNITGSNMTGNSFRFQGDVTAKANYSAIQYNVTLQNDGHGIIAASKTTGNIGDTVTLSNTANSHYGFSGYSITGSTLTGNQFKFNTSNVTAKAWFSAVPAYTLTLQNDGHGTLTANKVTGYPGDTVTLSTAYSSYYRFNNYGVTGGTVNGNTFTFGNSNATVKANYKANNFTATGTQTKNGVILVDGGWWTGNADAAMIYKNVTGSIPSDWIGSDGRWAPTNTVHNYSVTVQANAICYSQYTAIGRQIRANVLEWTGGGNYVSRAGNTLSNQHRPNTITVTTSYTTTSRNTITTTAYFKTEAAGIGQSFGLSATCNFTATGTAP